MQRDKLPYKVGEVEYIPTVDGELICVGKDELKKYGRDVLIEKYSRFSEKNREIIL